MRGTGHILTRRTATGTSPPLQSINTGLTRVWP